MRNCVRILFKNTPTTRLEKILYKSATLRPWNSNLMSLKRYTFQCRITWKLNHWFFKFKDASIELGDSLKENTGPGSPKHFINIDPINAEWELASDFYSKTLEQPDWKKMQVIMTHPQVFGQKFTPIRRFLAWKTHPFWPHIPNMTQYGSAPPPPPRGSGRHFFEPCHFA